MSKHSRRRSGRTYGRDLVSSNSLIHIASSHRFQGVPIIPYSMIVFDVGERLHNGTWTGAYGMLQSGIVDTWASYIALTEEVANDFLYSMPFVSQRYGLLMKRNYAEVNINMHGVFGGFQLDVYGGLAATVLILFAIMLVNEKRHERHIDDRVNKSFTLLR